MFGFDPEVPGGFQDADLEMRELEAEANRQAARERRDLTCPTCKTPGALTPLQAKRRHQCDTLYSVTRRDLGNREAREGQDRCYCGCKYFEQDTCIDCGTTISELLRDPDWRAENREWSA